MTPRDIQLRIRSGESLADVIAASGLPATRVEAFAAPILAEREHTTATALSSTVRRRGETASARRLNQTVAEALLDAGQDIDFVTWDSWRRSDGRWILQGTWRNQSKDMCARFIFDPKGRFSIAENDQARLLVSDLPLMAPVDVESEPTENIVPHLALVQSDLAEETTLGLRRDMDDDEFESFDEDDESDEEESLRSDIDLLYDMISVIDEDSVRIFRGLRQPLPPHVESPPAQPSLMDDVTTPAPDTEHPPAAEPSPRKGRKRASVPSWDDIIFGGQS
ncbi:MAG: septation protein SepH [Propionibacteriaceae bacterium]|nr:septation protein SepH [Propionibacteriaceae bacterium]